MKLKMFGVALTATLLLTIKTVQAQTYAESALQFGRTIPGGSARVLGIGGAQISLGGDYSSALSNPAGLGMYNRSEFTFSPGYSSLGTTANYLGNSDNSSKSSLNIPGISLVFRKPATKNNGFQGGALGISVTRVNDFNQSTTYHGTNKDNSIIDSFVGLANGDTDSQFDQNNYNYNTPTGLAYYNYLIGPKTVYDPSASPSEYFTDVNGIPNQQETITTKGSTSQISFAYGANYKDKLFFGGGIGITSLRFQSDKLYGESFSDNASPLSNLQLDESLDVNGNGINATLGVIARPMDHIQVGVSFVTPTIYQISETYSATMNTNWNSFDYYGDGKTILTQQSASTDIVTSNYSLTTPLKFSAGATFISKFGFLTGDVELVNPAKSRYSSNTTGLSFTGDNNDIKSNYRPVVNYRIGAEFRYKIFRARAGYGVQANTYNNSFDINNAITSISGGLGIRKDKFFVDFALVNSTGKNLYNPYNGAPIVDLSTSMTRGIVTVGFTF